MKWNDYRCTLCANIQELKIHDEELFPKTVKCNNCGSESKKIFPVPYGICHQGKVGNKKNGHTSTGGNIKKS